MYKIGDGNTAPDFIFYHEPIIPYLHDPFITKMIRAKNAISP